MPLASGLAMKIEDLAVSTSRAYTDEGSWKNKCSCSEPESMSSICTKARPIYHRYRLREEWL